METDRWERIKDELEVKNMDYLAKGICNLKVHIENMKKYLDNVIVCLNKFIYDTIVNTFMPKFI